MKFLRMMPITLMVLISLILIFAGIILAVSPGKIKPLTGSDGKPIAGSLSEKVFISLGGVRQGMFIQSRDTANPVLLYLHGGMPEFFLNRNHPSRLEEIFTVVWWEQRGSGISNDRKSLADHVTLEKLTFDALELAGYLRKRFDKEKIYLMGHSGGSFIAAHAVQQAPELFQAYIGVAQMTDQLQSEKLAYNYMLDQYTRNGSKIMTGRLKRSAISDSIPRSYLRIRDKAMHGLGVGTMHRMKSVITGIFFPSLFCPEYTFGEKVALWDAKIKSGVSPLWQDMITTDLKEKIPSLSVPVYFFSGIYDYTVNHNLSKEYLQKLAAPVKGFYLFENSAHSPQFEEPDRMLQILRDDILKQ